MWGRRLAFALAFAAFATTALAAEVGGRYVLTPEDTGITGVEVQFFSEDRQSVWVETFSISGDATQCAEEIDQGPRFVPVAWLWQEDEAVAYARQHGLSADTRAAIRCVFAD